MSELQEVRVPFVGFYHSEHNAVIDHAVGSIFPGPDGCPIEDMVERACSEIDVDKVFTQYAKAYTKYFASCVEDYLPSLRHSDLDRPRTYNSDIDRIFATVAQEDVARMFEDTPRELLADEIRKRFEPRPGWCPFYSIDIDKWPEDISKWDHNEVNTLMMVHLKHNGIDAQDVLKWEGEFCIEISDEGDSLMKWIYDATLDGWQALVDEHDQLQAAQPAAA